MAVAPICVHELQETSDASWIPLIGELLVAEIAEVHDEEASLVLSIDGDTEIELCVVDVRRGPWIRFRFPDGVDAGEQTQRIPVPPGAKFDPGEVTVSTDALRVLQLGNLDAAEVIWRHALDPCVHENERAETVEGLDGDLFADGLERAVRMTTRGGRTTIDTPAVQS